MSVMTLESSPLVELENQPEGSRFFVVRVRDADSGLMVRAALSFTPEMQEHAERVAVQVGIPPGGSVIYGVACETLHRMYGEVTRENFERVESIEEWDRERFVEYARHRHSNASNGLAD